MHPLSVPSSPHHLSVPSSPDTTQQVSTTNSPNAGMKFDTEEELQLYFQEYAYQVGFGVRRTSVRIEFEANGYENLPFGERDCRNYIAKVRQLRIGAGDAEALHARSRAAYESFGDVVTFDSTYLTNKYSMPFAPLVGVNHYGQSILFGCRLISGEDAETFVWLFKSWHMVKNLIEKDVKELPSRHILSRWRKDVKHRYNFITNCYDDLKSGEQVKQFDHLCANFYEAANIIDSPEKYEYLMKCLDEAKEKLIDASSCGVNHVSNSNEEELLPPWKVRGRGRPPKRKKSTIEKLTEKQRNKNKKNAYQGKKDKLPGKRGSSMSNLTDKINVDSVDMTNNTGNKHRAISVNKNRRNEGFDLNQSANHEENTSFSGKNAFVIRRVTC
nr:hypothetical protein [Tanacetum cinerariifolium]